MNCPRCHTVALTMTSRENVEIDYCASCRGVWLDRGELDKIIERTEPPRDADYRTDRRGPHEDFDDDFDDTRAGRFGTKRKRRGFLTDIFDF